MEMLVNPITGSLTPILKRKRTDSISSPAQETKKPVGNPWAQKCTQVLDRLRTTGLQSTYLMELKLLKESDVSSQLSWLLQLTSNIAVLDRAVSGLVLECIALPWRLNESAPLRSAYQSFLLSLVMTHSDYCKPVLRALFAMLLPEVSESDAILRVSPHTVSGRLSEHLLALDTLCAIHCKVPLSETLMLVQANRTRPYYKRHPHALIIYNKALLMLAKRIPGIRKKILEIIVHGLITIDVNCPRQELLEDDEDSDEEEEEVFKMDVTDTEEVRLQRIREHRLSWLTKHPVAHSLDVVMESLLLYLHCAAHGVPATLDCTADLCALRKIGCAPGTSKGGDCEDGAGLRGLTLGCQCGGELHDLAVLKQLYLDLRDVYADAVLSTHSSGHLQFLMFYLLSIRPGLTSIFIEFLRTKYFLNPSAALDVRKNSMAYIGSLLARGRFVPFSLVQSCLEVVVNWCHSYITEQETQYTNNYPSLAMHSTFYCACQTVFYVFTFRYREYTRNQKSLELARGLNLERLVFSKLNPLSVCTQTIVDNFAAVTRHYQLVYCYAVIESNRRNTLPMSSQYSATSLSGSALDMFFPFDPYLLLSSVQYIAPHYQDFQSLPDTISTASDAGHIAAGTVAPAGAVEARPECDEEDDFLEQSGLSVRMHSTSFLQYQLSPGQDTFRREELL